MSGQVEAKIEQLGHRLPAAPKAVGFYVPVLKTGKGLKRTGGYASPRTYVRAVASACSPLHVVARVRAPPVTASLNRVHARKALQSPTARTTSESKARRLLDLAGSF